jgi:assimilatory nitrate reductase catalytic subunit
VGILIIQQILGKLCSKGSTLHLTAQKDLQEQMRLGYPAMRTSKQDSLKNVSWSTATQYVAKRFADIITTHGLQAVGIYVSGQLLTEDYYLFNKLMKGLIGANNIDTNSRLCMSSAVAGYKQTLGMDAPPCCYEDIELASTVLITGSNMAFAHPILYRRLELARQKNPAMKVIVVDPRRTETAKDADLHLAIQPGTDVALYHGILHIILWENWLDEAYIKANTSGFEALRKTGKGFHT